MTDLSAAVDSYLAMRRGLGFKLVDAGSLLPDFVGYLHHNGAEHVSTELAVAWATQPVNAGPIWWRQRLGIVRGFADYLRNIDPDTEVPPRDLLPARQQRVAPYLYSAADIAALMAAARSLNPPLRAATYETFIGLLSVTGLRLGEALALNRDDLDKKRLLLIVRHAKRAGRKVPLHETTLRALQLYFDCVDRRFPEPASPSVFVSTRGTRMNRDSIHATFPVLIDRAGLTGLGQRPRPRIHDYADLRVMPTSA
jgi:integrase/recombinase XerD